MTDPLTDLLGEGLDIEMDGEYPTEAGLDAIRSWPVPDHGDLRPVFEAMRAVWRWASYFRSTEGVDDYGTPITTYEISTGGWSGHEDMLGALEDNLMVWTLTWVQVRRGGHYIFEARHRWAVQP